MITFQVEKLKDIISEIQPILIEHWNEIALHKSKIPFDVDVDNYFILESQGKLHIVTARKGHDLIGYFFSFVSPHIHYKSTLMACNDIVYLRKAYRRGLTGYKLIKYAEEALVELGVKDIKIAIKVYADFGKILKRLGYTHVENVYDKLVEGGT